MKQRPHNYTFEDIRRYREGSMTKEEMHAFEKASMEDPFLADALEGYMAADMQLADEHLNNITQRITGKEEEKAKVVAMPASRFRWMRVAAMVIVLAGAGLLTYKLVDKDKVTDNGSIAKVDDTKPAENNPNAKTAESDSGYEVNLGIDETTKPKDPNGYSAKSKNNLDVSTSTAKDAVVKNGNKKEAIATKDKENKIAQGSSALAEVKVEPSGLFNTEKKEAKVKDNTTKDNVASAPANTNNTYEWSQNNQTKKGEEIRGTVLNNSDQPVANAKVKFDNRKIATTDNQGNFRMNSKDTVVNATVSSYGYEKSNVQLKPNTDNTVYLDVQLQRDPAAEEVTVTAIGRAKQKVTKDTTSIKPEGGWQTFQGYIATRLTKADSTAIANANDAEVEIEFSTDKYGNPKDVKVVRSSKPALNKEVIEAIQEGPRWTTKKRRANLLIKF